VEIINFKYYERAFFPLIMRAVNGNKYVCIWHECAIITRSLRLLLLRHATTNFLYMICGAKLQCYYNQVFGTRYCALSLVYFCRNYATCKYSLLCIILCSSIYGHSGCAILFRNYLINGTIFEYIYIVIYLFIYLTWNACFDFLYNLVIRKYCLSRRNSGIYYHRRTSVRIFLCNFNQNWVCVNIFVKVLI
jgi:hypothetical protein